MMTWAGGLWRSLRDAAIGAVALRAGDVRTNNDYYSVHLRSSAATFSVHLWLKQERARMDAGNLDAAAPDTPAVGYEGRPATKPPNWHGLVTLDMVLNNLSTGLFLVAAVGELLAPGVFRPLAALVYPLVLLFLLGDLVCLVLDLGDVRRFHHMLRIWKPSSPMSFGTWVITAYSVPVTLLAILSLWV